MVDFVEIFGILFKTLKLPLKMMFLDIAIIDKRNVPHSFYASVYKRTQPIWKK